MNHKIWNEAAKQVEQVDINELDTSNEYTDIMVLNNKAVGEQIKVEKVKNDDSYKRAHESTAASDIPDDNSDSKIEKINYKKKKIINKIEARLKKAFEQEKDDYYYRMNGKNGYWPGEQKEIWHGEYSSYDVRSPDMESKNVDLDVDSS